MSPAAIAAELRGYLRNELRAENRREIVRLVVAELVVELQGDQKRAPLRDLLPYGDRYAVNEAKQALVKAADLLEQEDPFRVSDLRGVRP